MITGEDPSAAGLIAARPHLSRHVMDGLLVEGVPLQAIADDIGTPTYVYSAGAIRARLAALSEALHGAGLNAHVHYAVKANDHLAVLRVMRAFGAGADVVSGGELLRAKAAGIPPSDIVFSGVGKTDDELRLAVQEQIASINVESVEELARLSAIATAMGRTARVLLRINPDVDANTHAKITTGRKTDKFGIPFGDAVAAYRHACELPGLAPFGLAEHIGSQIFSMAPFTAAFDRIAELVIAIRAEGFPVTMVDCGGGLGVGYRGESEALPEALAGAIAASFRGMGLRVAVEMGRWLTATSGVLLTSVVQEKLAAGTRFVVLDAAMNDLVRPAMYDAWHGIVPVSAVDLVAPVTPAEVVGPVCESSDKFATARALPVFAPGSRVAILDAGAYGAVMSSAYNARPFAAQVLVDGNRFAVIRKRQKVEQLWAQDIVPEWIA
jgi:diaminopimelate decarboxylase